MEESGRSWLLAATLLASVLASLDLFVVNLAFASISASFPEAAPQTMSWILNAYGIAFAALLVPSGRLADRFGRLRLFRFGLGLFAAGSLLAAVAPGIGVLIGARGLQGVGAALIVPTSLALLLAQYQQSRHKQMVSIWSASGSVAAAAGPVLGGLLSSYDWRWIFVINVPIAIVALLSTISMKEEPRQEAKTPDLVGVGLLAVGIGALVAALSYATDWGLGSPRLWTMVVASLAATVWFIRRCLVQGSPAVDLRVFSTASFSVAAVGMAGFYIGFAIMLLGGSLFLTSVWGWSPLVAGLGFAVGPGTAVAAALLAGRTRLSPRWLAGLGSALFVLGGALWALLLGAGAESVPVMFAGLAVTGAGAGVAQTGFLAGGVSPLPPESYATGTGVLNTARQIGSALGVAALIAIVGAGTNASSYQLAWIVLSCSGLAGVLSALLIRGRSRGAGTTADAGDAASVRPIDVEV
ncbi:MFS transporter [Arthrobacter sp. 35W]|uniref:MFS transporter n=1 Tax=Arthrobacter sp. 35W TaxID=1132441 RepID=UPI00040EDE6F|nr:MFS transporter [Arthrobacter sp. 35W]